LPAAAPKGPTEGKPSVAPPGAKEGSTAMAHPAGLPAVAPANAGAKAGGTFLQSIRAARAARGGT
jgi:hypothetical protein